MSLSRKHFVALAKIISEERAAARALIDVKVHVSYCEEVHEIERVVIVSAPKEVA